MKRRMFLVRGGQTLACALAAYGTESSLQSKQRQSQDSADTVEQRVTTVIQAYDGQGNHRTGTEVDKISAEWLAGEVRQLGVTPSLEPFSRSRVDPQSCYLRIGGRRIDGVPLFDASFTDSAGVRGRLGPADSNAEIGLLEIGPFKLAAPRAEHEARSLWRDAALTRV